MKPPPRAHVPRWRVIQPMLRGLRIAAMRSANIGGSLATPAPLADRPDRKGRVTSLLCPTGLAARAMRQSAAAFRRRNATATHIIVSKGEVLCVFDGRATRSKQGKVFPRHCRGGERGYLGHIIGRRNLDHIHAGKCDPAQLSQDPLRLP